MGWTLSSFTAVPLLRGLDLYPLHVYGCRSELTSFLDVSKAFKRDFPCHPAELGFRLNLYYLCCLSPWRSAPRPHSRFPQLGYSVPVTGAVRSQACSLLSCTAFSLLACDQLQKQRSCWWLFFPLFVLSSLSCRHWQPLSPVSFTLSWIIPSTSAVEPMITPLSLVYLMTFIYIFKNFCVFEYMYMCALHACLLPLEARRETEVSGTGVTRLLWATM